MSSLHGAGGCCFRFMRTFLCLVDAKIVVDLYRGDQPSQNRPEVLFGCRRPFVCNVGMSNVCLGGIAHRKVWFIFAKHPTQEEKILGPVRLKAMVDYNETCDFPSLSMR